MVAPLAQQAPSLLVPATRCSERRPPARRRAFVGKSFARSLDEARFTFFSEDLPKGDLIRYQQQLAACSPVRLLDLAALNKARGAAARGGRGTVCGAQLDARVRR